MGAGKRPVELLQGMLWRGGGAARIGSKEERGNLCSMGAAGPEPSATPPRCCLCPARPRFAPGVTIEEDNCCGCNAIAIRRHFLDENMTAVDIVYTSCHDAVRGRGRLGQAGVQPPPSLGPLQAPGRRWGWGLGCRSCPPDPCQQEPLVWLAD